MRTILVLLLSHSIKFIVVHDQRSMLILNMKRNNWRISVSADKPIIKNSILFSLLSCDQL